MLILTKGFNSTRSCESLGLEVKTLGVGLSWLSGLVHWTSAMHCSRSHVLCNVCENVCALNTGEGVSFLVIGPITFL